MARSALQFWEIAGFFFIVVAGSLLHFVFAWSGNQHYLAWLAAVNESTWEHLKLAFWPGLFWALLEFIVFGGDLANFWPAKFLGLLTILAAIIVFFYGYTAILGRHCLVLDIAVFILAVALGQALSYRILLAPDLGPVVRVASVLGLLALTAAFTLFSYYPPRFFLFEDPRTGGFGIPAVAAGGFYSARISVNGTAPKADADHHRLRVSPTRPSRSP